MTSRLGYETFKNKGYDKLREKKMILENNLGPRKKLCPLRQRTTFSLAMFCFLLLRITRLSPRKISVTTNKTSN